MKIDINTIIIFFLIIVIIIETVYILFITRKDKKQSDIEDLKIFFKQLWAKFALYVLATSIILLFVASFIWDKKITITAMNEWVSLVLGLVALIIGIISLWLSFYNVDQSMKSQEDNLKIMQAVKEEIGKELRETKSDIIEEIGKIPEKTAHYRVFNNSNIKNKNNSKNNNWSGVK